jgi:trehalose-6-phosphate synthase
MALRVSANACPHNVKQKSADRTIFLFIHASFSAVTFLQIFLNTFE